MHSGTLGTGGEGATVRLGVPTISSSRLLNLNKVGWWPAVLDLRKGVGVCPRVPMQNGMWALTYVLSSPSPRREHRSA